MIVPQPVYWQTSVSGSCLQNNLCLATFQSPGSFFAFAFFVLKSCTIFLKAENFDVVYGLGLVDKSMFFGSLTGLQLSASICALRAIDDCLKLITLRNSVFAESINSKPVFSVFIKTTDG